MAEQLLTVKEVAEILRVQEPTLRAWLRQGKISAIKLPGGDFRITQETLSIILGKQPA